MAHELDVIILGRERPDKFIRDNGTEYASDAILAWADDTAVGRYYIAPGETQQNGFNEGLQRKFARRAASLPRGNRQLQNPKANL